MQAGGGPNADEAVVGHAGMHVAVCTREQAVALFQGLAFGDGGYGAVAVQTGIAHLKCDATNDGHVLRGHMCSGTKYQAKNTRKTPNELPVYVVTHNFGQWELTDYFISLTLFGEIF